MQKVAWPFALPGKETPHPQLVLTRPLPATEMRWGQILLPANQPVMIVPKMEQRLDLLIVNTGMAVIFLDRDGSVSIARSFPFPAGAGLSISNFVGEIWAICAVPIVLGLSQSIY